MLLVETYIDNSAGKGMGLFAKQYISKGEKYWMRNELFDKVITEIYLSYLPNLAVQFIKKYGFMEITTDWYLCGDNAKYSNHSDLSNTNYHFDKDGLIEFYTALKDIAIGEEIFCDYRKICSTCAKGIDFLPIL